MSLEKLSGKTKISEAPRIIDKNFEYINSMIGEFYKEPPKNKIRVVNNLGFCITAPVLNDIIISKKGSFNILEVKELTLETLNVQNIKGFIKSSDLSPDHFEIDAKTNRITISSKLFEVTNNINNIINQDTRLNLRVGVGSGPSEFTNDNTNNISIGSGTLSNINTGGGNIVVGVNSMTALLDANRIICIGENSAKKILRGSDCVIIGSGITLTETEIHDRIIIGNASNILLDGNTNTGVLKLPMDDTSINYSGDVILSSNIETPNIIIGANLIPNRIKSLSSSNIVLGYNNGLISSMTTNNIIIGNNINEANTIQDLQNRLFIGDLISGVLSGVNKYISLNATIKVPNIDSGNSGTLLGVDENNNIVKLTSSRRYKSKIENTILINSCDVVEKLQPVLYSDKNGNGRYYGLIAEDVAQVEDKLVNYIEENGEKIIDSVSYDRIVVPLIDYVKTLNAKITHLEKIIKQNV